MERQTKQFPVQVKAAGLKDRQLKFVISTGDVDRSGDTIDPYGWDLSHYQLNPVVQFAHSYSTIPIGKAVSIGLEGDQLVSVVQFPEPGSYELADTVYRMAKQGFLNGASVGFLPTEWETIKRADGRLGMSYKKQSLIEWSVVPIGDNPYALRVASLMKGLARTKGGPMRDDEVFDIDADAVREAVRAVVREQLLALTGQLDTSAGPRHAVTPLGRVALDAAGRTPRQASDAVVLELADEPPPCTRAALMERLGYTYEGIGRMYARAGVSNARYATPTPR